MNREERKLHFTRTSNLLGLVMEDILDELQKLTATEPPKKKEETPKPKEAEHKTEEKLSRNEIMAELKKYDDLPSTWPRWSTDKMESELAVRRAIE